MPKAPASFPQKTAQTLTDEQIAALASSCWKDHNQVIAVAVALAESGGRESAENYCCVGIWQVNVLVHPYTREDMKNAVNNVKAACAIYNAAHGWTPWESYTVGAYLVFMPRATIAVNKWKKSGATENVEPLLEPFGGAHSEGAAEAAAKAAVSWTKGFAEILKFIGSGEGWARIIKVGGGIAIVLIALAELAKVGSGSQSKSIPKKVLEIGGGVAAAKVAKVGKGTTPTSQPSKPETSAVSKAEVAQYNADVLDELGVR
jgi:hypothetical protein